MNIAITAPSYLFTDTDISSEGYTVYELSKRLAARGHIIYIAAPEVRLNSSIPNCAISQLGPQGIMPLTDPARELSKWWIFSLRSRFWLRKLIEREKIDIVHHFFPSTPGDFSLLGDLHPHFIFGPEPLPHEGLLPEEFVFGVRRQIAISPLLRRPYVALRNQLYRRTLRHAKRILIQVPSVLPYVRHADPTSVNRVEILTLGVDTSRFKPSADVNQEENRILFVGGLTRIKGLDYLIDAMPQVLRNIPNAKLIIVGDGPDRAYFEDRARATGHGSRISFLGFIPRDQIQIQYRQCEIFCLPSIAESFSLSILEAMSSAKPIVATQVGGGPLIASDIALFVPPRNSNHLAQALIQLLENSKLRRELGKKGRERAVEQYDWNIITRRVEEIYNRCAV